MSKETIAEKVRDLIHDQLGISYEQIKPECNFFQDFRVDSLDIVELAMNIEDEFGFEIPDIDQENLKTVGDLIKYVQEHVEQT